MSYDLLDRLLTVNAPGHPGGVPISYLYDENSNLTVSATPWGLFTSTYDPRDQILTLKDPGFAPASVPAGITTFTHDARMQLSQQVFANSAVATTTYDPNMRMAQRLHSSASHVEIDHCWVLYDADDRPLTRSTHAGVSTFGYDLCDRVLTEWDPIQRTGDRDRGQGHLR